MFGGIGLDKKAIYELLDSLGIKYECTEHKAVYNMEEAAQIALPHPEAEAKNLFVRDDKKKNYYLITVKGDKRVDLKKFRNENDTRPLSFASCAELESILKLSPGSVTPFGALNDEEKRVKVFIDEDLIVSDLAGVHPNDNTATVWIKTSDLIRIIKQHGNEVYTFHV